MISESISKADFIVQILDRDVKNIYMAQKLIAERSIYISGKDLKSSKKKGTTIGRRTGSLLRSLSAADYDIRFENGQFNVSSQIALHTRFLDMKKFGGHRIYNAQVWGILYGTTLPTIKYKYGQRIYDLVGQALQRALKEQG